MPRIRLSDRTIRDLKSVARDTMLSAGVRGLYVRISPAGTKIFILRQQRSSVRNGRRVVVNRQMRLGRFPA